MILPDTQFKLAKVPLRRILITEYQERYPERVLHYYRLLTDPQHARNYAGVVSLKPCNDGAHFELLDGHHRFLASVMAGRSDILALILIEPGQPGYDVANAKSVA